jgi:hypothetical protein
VGIKVWKRFARLNAVFVGAVVATMHYQPLLFVLLVPAMVSNNNSKEQPTVELALSAELERSAE